MTEVGGIKITVAVEVGVSVDVPVGSGVRVGVLVGGGSKMAVCVCAAAAVPATMVSIERGSVSDDVGADRTGNSQASKKSNAANKRIDFLTICLSMVIDQRSYLTSMMNFTRQKSLLPTLSDHLVEYTSGRFGVIIEMLIVTLPPGPTVAGIS